MDKLRYENKTFCLGKLVLGTVATDGYETWFVTHREQGHFFIKYGGFGFNKELIIRLIAMGIEDIRLIYHGKEGSEAYRTRASHVLKLGKKYDNEGEEQLVMNKKFFKTPNQKKETPLGKFFE